MSAGRTSAGSSRWGACPSGTMRSVARGIAAAAAMPIGAEEHVVALAPEHQRLRVDLAEPREAVGNRRRGRGTAR